MPIEVMAERGPETLRFGPMKPVGLDNPHAATPEHPEGRWPHAWSVAADNKLGTLWNMVGFQTKLKHAEQVRLFRTIPAWRTPIRTAGRDAPQHLPQLAAGAGQPVAAQRR
jgi:methylenetetrahydrofolate--tRNA-(uracil-5-)-methyltransferase